MKLDEIIALSAETTGVDVEDIIVPLKAKTRLRGSHDVLRRRAVCRLHLSGNRRRVPPTSPLRVFEAFAGYGSQALALRRLKRAFPTFDYRVVGVSEIDPHALNAYRLIHGHCPNHGDISKVDWSLVPDFDLFTYSFPCQDISSAGLQRGFAEGSGSRSSLLWECRRAIETKRPRFLLMENVKALIQKKHLPDFHKWISWLEEQGYKNFWQVLNAKDYGVPQNRERVFMVSILDPKARFEFPKPFPLERRLKDVLEPDVDESFYLSDDKVQRIIAHCERKQAEGCGFKTNFIDPQQTTDDKNISGCIKTKEGSRQCDTYIKEHILQCTMGNVKPTAHFDNAPTVTASAYQDQNFVVKMPT